MKKVKKPAKDLENELKYVNKALKLNPSSTTLLKQKMQLLAESVNATKTNLNGMKAALEKASANGATEKNSASFRRLQREIEITEADLKRLEKEQKLFGSVGVQQVGALGNKYKALGGKITAVGSALTSTVTAWGFVGIYAGSKMIELSETQAQQEEKLTEIYKTRLGEGTKAVKSTEKLASEQQKLGVVGDEVQLAFAQQMATFSGSSKTVNTLLPAFNNLLVQQKGLNGTTEDAVSLGNMFGKVMTGQTSALKRVGITFTDAQEEVLKYGTEEEKAAMLAEVITQNVGNMNETFAQTDAGKIQQAKNELGDLGERMGAVLLPAVASVAAMFEKDLFPIIEKVIKVFEDNPALGEFALKLAVVAAATSPLVLAVGKIVSTVGSLMSVISTIAPMINAPMVIIAAIIGYLVVLYNTSETFRNAVQSAIKQIVTSVKQLWKALQPLFGQLNSTLMPLIRKHLNLIGTALAAIIPIITRTITIAISRATAVVKAITSILTAAKIVGNKLHATLTNPFKKVLNTVKSFVNKIKSKLGALKSFKWLKAPHLKISAGKIPYGIGGAGKKPKISIDWYRKAMSQGMELNGATIFGAMNGKWLGGGEAGSETIVGTNSLYNMITSAVSSAVNGMGNSVASAVATGMQIATSGGEGGQMSVNVYLYKNGPQMGRYIVDTYDTYKRRLG